MTATLCRTPSEWLLARYDREMRRCFGPLPADWRRTRRDRGESFDRRIFDLLDDHPGSVCTLNDEGLCCSWSGSASWPTPVLGEGLDDADILAGLAVA